MAKQKILLIDDDVDICTLLKRFLERQGFDVLISFRGEEGLQLLKKNEIDVVLTDFRLPDLDGFEMIQAIKEINTQVPVIVITGYSDVKQAVKVIQLGAFEYVTKPIYPEEIVLLLKEAINSRPLEATSEEFVSDAKENTKKQEVAEKTQETIAIGNSPKSRNIQKQIDLVAPTDITVVILGESGTGKEVVARRIHQSSHRKEKPFIAVDCGALPHELAASELFGHVKGAFTGALSDKKGQFELANGGTLFLDEIGNLSYENQIKLLRVLQERKIRRLGSEQDMPIDVRIVTATNEDLKKSMEKGTFREDIYFRLNEFKIELPPLRENIEDLPAYAYHFLKDSNRFLSKDIEAFSTEVMTYFKSYSWPGNIRELKNVIKRAVLLTNSNQIEADVLPNELKLALYNTADEVSAPTGVETHQLTAIKTLKEEVEIAEKKAIENALVLVDFNKSKCAEILGIDRRTLYNKLHAYQINFKGNE